MDYLISLLEGVITFVSPCMLPMLPIYGLYFAAGESDKRKALFNSLGFVLGFTVVFVSLGAFAGTFGRLLADYGKWVNLAAGAIITVFGLNYLNIFSLPFFHGYRKIDYRPENRGFFPSALFGMTRTILYIVLFVLLILFAGAAYNYLSERYGSEGQLAAPTPTVEPSTDEPQETAGPENGAGAGEKNTGEDEEKKVKAPDFTVYDEGGNEIKLSEYFGTPIVLNFWASWCGPCKSEMPHFNKVSEEYSEDELIFLMVNLTDGQKETKETAKGFIEKSGHTFHVLFDTDQDAANEYTVMPVPVTYFIDREGYLKAYGEGMMSEDSLRSGIDMIYTEE